MYFVHLAIYSLIIVILDQATKGFCQCIDSCSSRTTGNYQACGACDSYASCVNGQLFIRPCTLALEWDDQAKTCLSSSTTCSPASVSSKLVAFWPLNCQYYTLDITGNGLSAPYSYNDRSSPQALCQLPNTPLSGAYSFETSLTGSVVTPKFLQMSYTLSDRSIALSLRYTWTAYIMVRTADYFMSQVPIFSLARDPAWANSHPVGFGVFWEAGNIQIWAANRDSVIMRTFGSVSRIKGDQWYKLLLGLDTWSQSVRFRVSPANNLNDILEIKQDINSGFVPYLNGKIRLGYLDPANNGNKNQVFTGSLTCVQIWADESEAFADSIWTDVPAQCVPPLAPSVAVPMTTTAIPTDDVCTTLQPCTNTLLSGDLGRVNGQCVLTLTSYYCQCPRGYRWQTQLQVCTDIDETLVQNCGCQDNCVNKYVDRDGVMYECMCTTEGLQLGPDGHKCISIDTIVMSLKVWPRFGPRAGGTAIYIQDSALTGRVEVVIGTTALTVLNSDVSGFVATTTPLLNTTLLNVAQPVLIRHNGRVYAELTFTYGEDPVILTVAPLTAFAAGGTILTVSGRHLTSVADPKLTINRTNSQDMYSTTCSTVSAQQMECATPTIDALTVHSEKRKRRQTARELEKVFIGFDMDGVDQYRDLSQTLPDYSKVSVVMNPEFQPFPGDGILQFSANQRLDIQGQYMSMGATVSDYSVGVENEACSHLDLTDNILSCKPPQTPPAIDQTGMYREGLHRVKVQVGYYQSSLGYLRYDSTVNVLVIGGCVGGACLLLILLIVCVCCCHRNKGNKSKEKKEVFEDHHDFTYRGGRKQNSYYGDEGFDKDAESGYQGLEVDKYQRQYTHLQTHNYQNIDKVKATHGDKKATHGDKKATHGDKKATHGDKKANHGDKKATHGDKKAYRQKYNEESKNSDNARVGGQVTKNSVLNQPVPLQTSSNSHSPYIDIISKAPRS